jgi:16S rRNA (adenine1518-N6/adenine1519-N6)-dimethyltransferase
MPPRKSRPQLGQHFLRDKSVCIRIADAVVSSPDTPVIEIGPGQGALTEHLVARGVPLTAIEVDPALADGLKDRFSTCDHFEVIHQDILKTDLSSVIAQYQHNQVVIAGNLPYYITSPILRAVFAAAAHIDYAVFLIQKEVALRLTARKNSRDYGYLSVLCQLHAEPELLFTVPPGAFTPPPEVTSSVVRLKMRRDIDVPPSLIDFLQHCFTHRRKKLLNNLAGLYPKEVLRQHPESDLRAQQLDLAELRAFWQTLDNASEPG